MNKYNIKVGDYVETWGGDIGVVEEVANHAFVYKITLSNSNNYIKGMRHWCPNDSISSFKPFKRVGANDFSKNKDELESIERLDICYATGNELECKLNELIDHINAIQERLNEDGLEKERH